MFGIGGSIQYREAVKIPTGEISSDDAISAIRLNALV
jgi:hypothetical protein